MTATQRKALGLINGWWKTARVSLGVSNAKPPRIHFVPAGSGFLYTTPDPDGVLSINVTPRAAEQIAAHPSESQFEVLHEFARVYQGLNVWGEGTSGNAGSGPANAFANRQIRHERGKGKADPKGYAKKHFPDFGKKPRSITIEGKARAVSAPRKKRSTPARRVQARAKAKAPKRRRGKVGKQMGSVREWLIEKLGADPEKVDALDGIEKAGMPTTFAERMAQRELDDELPDAMSVLRSCIFWAFNPPSDATDVDPKQVISESLDQFKAWALSLVDRTNGEDVAKMIEDAETGEAAVLKLAREGLAIRKSQAPKSDSATVDDVDVEDIIGSDETETASVEDRISDLEETVAKITPENIAKAMKQAETPGSGGDGDGDGDGSGDGDGDGAGDGDDQTAARQPVTKADLEAAIDKIVKDAADKINEVESKIQKLGEGGSSQGKDDIEKAEDENARVAKAMEAEGFSEKDAAALGGIFN